MQSFNNYLLDNFVARVELYSIIHIQLLIGQDRVIAIKPQYMAS